MPERKNNYKASLFLSGAGTTLLAVTAAVIRLAGGLPGGRLLYSFLPLAMACYAVAFAVGLLAARQANLGRAGGKWTPALLCSGLWAAAVIGLAFYGLIQTFLVFRLGF